MSTYRIGMDAALPEEGVEERASVRANAIQAPEGGIGQFGDKLTKWIPGDALALYTTGVTTLTPSGKSALLFLIGMIVITPLFTLAWAYRGGAFDRGVQGRAPKRSRGLVKLALISAAGSAVAFSIWSLTVPSNGWQYFRPIADNSPLVALFAAAVGTIFCNIAERVARQLQPD